MALQLTIAQLSKLVDFLIMCVSYNICSSCTNRADGFTKSCRPVHRALKKTNFKFENNQLFDLLVSVL